MERSPRDPTLYSQLVQILKVVLPITAIVLMSTIFLIQAEDPLDGVLVFSDFDRGTLSEGLTIRNPEITGVSDQGRAFRISAATAIPDGPTPKTIRFTQFIARMDDPNGESVDIVASQGVAEVQSQILRILGDVRIKTSNGYSARTEGAVADIQGGWLETSTEAIVEGPVGTITSGKLRIEDRDGTNQFLSFGNGVKVTYLPNANMAEQ